MEEMVERLCCAVRKSDYAEVKLLVQRLVLIGACDSSRAQEILGYAPNCKG